MIRSSSLSDIRRFTASLIPVQSQRFCQLTEASAKDYLATCLKEANPQLLARLLTQMDAQGLHTLDLSGQDVGAEGMACLVAVLQDHPLLTSHFTGLDFSHATLSDPLPLLQLLAKQASGVLKTISFQGTQFEAAAGSAPDAAVKCALLPKHLEAVATIVARSPRLQRLDLSHQPGLAVVVNRALQDGDSETVPCLSVVADAIGRSSVTDVKLSSCELRGEHLFYIGKAIAAREAKADAEKRPGTGLKLVDLRQNPGVGRDYESLMSFVTDGPLHSQSLQHLYLPQDSLRHFIDYQSQHGPIDLAQNHVLLTLEPVSSSDVSCLQPIGEILCRNRVELRQVLALCMHELKVCTDLRKRVQQACFHPEQ